MDASIGGRGTQSRSSTVRVHYRFHPLHERELEVVCTPRAAEGAVTVVDPTGRRLKIPSWMLSSEAAELHLSEQARISVSALRNLAELLTCGVALRTGDTTNDSLAPGRTITERRGTRGTTSTGGRSSGGRRRATFSTTGAEARAQGGVGGADGAGTPAGASGARRQR